MAGEQLLLDPTSEGTGTQLDITDQALGYFLLSHEYPDPDPDVVQAGSIDTEGSRPAAGTHKARTITATVRCVQPAGGTPSIGTIVSNLQRKVGKLFFEGGTYRRVLPSGDAITFDVQRFGARINVPADKRWIVRGTVDVTITLTCQPYGRGAAITLTGHTASNTKTPLVFTETAIKGDVPALGSLVIANATNSKSFAAWGVQSRRYDSDTAANLLLEGEDGITGTNTTLNAGYSGASGGGSNKVMRFTNVGTITDVSYYRPIQTGKHVGTFRALARVQADSANAGIVSLRLSYFPQNLGSHVDNDWIPIQDDAGAAVEGAWVLVDLGLVTIPPPRVSGGTWGALLWAKSTSANDDLDVDWVVLVPADEGSGYARQPSISSTRSMWITSARVDFGSGTSWASPDFYEGDYLLVPVAGAEGRTARFIVMLSGDNFDSYGTVVDATNFDAITATLTYTPRYLSVPAP